MGRRILVLWKRPSGYLLRCLDELAREADVLLCHHPVGGDAPFEIDVQGKIDSVCLDVHRADLPENVRSFSPDLSLVSSWETPAYRNYLRKDKPGSMRVLCMDNQWKASGRQILGVATRSVYIEPLFDAAFVPGERQRQFARRLGFDHENIYTGLYTCDTESFSSVAAACEEEFVGRQGFAFVGRLVPEKGADLLIPAYQRYRADGGTWALRIAGEGPARKTGSIPAGVDFLGFVQPPDLPSVLQRSTALLLPSRFEPWGIVVHEAAAAGLLPLVSRSVGAGDEFVIDGVNGSVMPRPTPDSLADAMLGHEALSSSQRWSGSQVSRILANARTPSRWARSVLSMLDMARTGPS